MKINFGKLSAKVINNDLCKMQNKQNNRTRKNMQKVYERIKEKIQNLKISRYNGQYLRKTIDRRLRKSSLKSESKGSRLRLRCYSLFLTVPKHLSLFIFKNQGGKLK